MREIDEILQRLGDVEGASNRLMAATDGLSADLVRCVLVLSLLDGLSASFERIINEQRNHEFIIFGLSKVPSENCTETITRVSSFLDVSVSSIEDFSCLQKFVLVFTYCQIYNGKTQ
ncbi:hypothetical protein ALC53_04419 [Atta colombica]|uniref:Uncharacterized protein n=1 Tax=Atta colombica TaxID=520822 RepID=A0A195BK28_9HYME|nr:hypothetical protein ALC53_04419 [Atta colombica]